MSSPSMSKAAVRERLRWKRAPREDVFIRMARVRDPCSHIASLEAQARDLLANGDPRHEASIASYIAEANAWRNAYGATLAEPAERALAEELDARVRDAAHEAAIDQHEAVAFKLRARAAAARARFDHVAADRLEYAAATDRLKPHEKAALLPPSSVRGVDGIRQQQCLL